VLVALDETHLVESLAVLVEVALEAIGLLAADRAVAESVAVSRGVLAQGIGTLLELDGNFVV